MKTLEKFCAVALAAGVAGCGVSPRPVAEAEPDSFEETPYQPGYNQQNRNQITAIAEGRAQEAADYFQEYRKSYDDLESLFGLVVAHTQLGDLAKAMDYLELSVARGLPFERYLAGPRDLLDPLYSSPAFQKLATRHVGELLHGPMLGAVTDRSARFWVRTAHEVSVTVRLSSSPDLRDAITSSAARTSRDRDYTAVVEAEGLSPETQYYYEVIVDGRPCTIDPRPAFRTLPARGAKSKFLVAFGGCSGFAPPNERMWDVILGYEPLAFLQLGDNVYHDAPAILATQRYCHYRRQSRPEYRRLTAATPLFAIWDDHDFGGNDSQGGPKVDEPAWKVTALKVFEENFVSPRSGVAEDGQKAPPGLWFDFSIGDVDFFMLDGRYFRSLEDTDPPRTMLGPAQKRWLLEKLEASKATFKLIVSPVAWSEGAKPSSLDTWDGFPEEREEIFSFIESRGIGGVVLLSSDRHRSEAWKIERAGAPFFELLSGRLTNLAAADLVDGPLFSYNAKCTFGRLAFDTTKDDPELAYTIVNIEGEELYTLTITKSQLARSPAER